MKRTKMIVGVVTVVLVVGIASCYVSRKKTPAMGFDTVAVKRGNLVATIGATGTVEPEEVVDVGAQVAGLILGFGNDKAGKTIDYGSEVEAGTVLARIDDSAYAAQAAQAGAQLQQAKAQVASAEANLEQLKAKLNQAQRDWERAQKIGPSDALAQSLYDSYEEAYESAKANVTAGEAAILLAHAMVAQSEAAVSRAQLDLGYCVIKSPVKGVIIDRRVNVGQTVVSSLNTPSLFLIAKDLKRMQVWVAVNEADIGNIKPGQSVTFTVDAYPGQVFTGQVGKVRLNASMTQNVVTYTVEVITDNSNGKLLPYLTANVQFEVGRREGVLMVPNAALRWSAPPQLIAKNARGAGSGGQRKAGGGSGGAPGGGGAAVSGADSPRGTVWVQDGKFVRPIRVQAGLSDGTMTEVQSDKLPEGTEVVISQSVSSGHGGSAADTTSAGTNTNPFIPQMPGRRR